MDFCTLLEALKAEDTKNVKKLLNSVSSESWPVEILLPFVLRKSLQNLQKCIEICYVERCFSMLTRCQRLQELQQREAAELHRLSLVAESLYAMLKCGCCRKDIDKLGDYVMRRYQAVVRRYGCRRYGPQFRYLVSVCHRRTRLLDFRKRHHTLFSKIIDMLRRRGLNFVDQLISVMIT